MERSYKRPKRQAVSLTSLLDLLFVMIFVSLIQQKAAAPTKEEPVPAAKVTEQKAPKQKFQIRRPLTSMALLLTRLFPLGSTLWSAATS